MPLAMNSRLPAPDGAVGRTLTQREIREFGTDAAPPANPGPAAESLAQDQSIARTT
jgi:hypothetical protein